MENLDYKFLFNISRAINIVRDSQDLPRVMMDEVRPLFGFHDVGIFVLDKQSKRHRDLSIAFPDTAPLKANNGLNAAGLAGWLPHEGSLIERHIQRCERANAPLIFTFAEMLAEFLDYPFLEIVKPVGIQDFLATPLRVRGATVGILYFKSLESGFFKPSQFSLFQAIADQVAVAASNILANEEIVEQTREKALLLSLSEDLATIRQRDDLWRVITTKLQPIIGFDDAVVIDFKDSAFSYRHFLTAASPSRQANPLYQEVVGDYFPVAGTPYEHILTLGSYYEWRTSELLELYPDHSGLLLCRETNLNYCTGLQLNWGGELIGLLQFGFTEDSVQSKPKANLYKAIGDQVTVAVANILVNEEIIEREREKSQLLEISEAIARINDRDDLLRVIIKQVQPVFRFDDNALFVIDPDGEHYRLWYANTSVEYEQGRQSQNGRGIPIKDNAVAKDVFERQVHLLNREEMLILAAGDESLIKWVVDSETEESLIAPLRVGGQVIGCFNSHSRKGGTFSENKFRLYQNVADQLAVAVANILANEEIVALAEERRLRAEQLAKSNEALARTSARLTEQPDLTAFLGQVVIEACDQLRADAGHLIVHDEKRGLLHTAALVENGKVVAIDPLAEEMPATEAGFFPLLRELREPRYFDVEREEKLLWRGAADYLRERNKKHVIAFPLMAGQSVLGVLGLAFGDKSSIAEEQSELVGALAHQAALAIQLTRLADEAKQAAVAKEQEKAAQEKAEELAKVNEALRGGVERLVEAQTIESILDVFVVEAIRATGAAGGAVLRRMGDDTEFEFATVAQDDHITRETLAVELAATIGEVSRRDPAGFFAKIISGEFIAVTTDELATWYPIAAAYHRDRGNETIWNVPFRVGGKTVGYLGLAIDKQREPDRATHETLDALALQAAMALELRQKSDEAKEAAIAREQEKAAQEKAAELVRANQILSNVNARLADETRLEALLGHVLAEACDMLGANDGCIFLLDETSQTLRMVTAYFEGQPSADLPGYPFGPNNPVSVADFGWAQMVASERQPLITPFPDPEIFHKDVIRWHQERGHTGILAQVLKLGKRPVGMLGLSYNDGREFTHEQLEFLQALGQQAALAVQATRLADETKEAAVIKEQEKAAQARAVELVQANKAIQHSTLQLSSLENVELFVAGVLLEIIKETNAKSAVVFQVTPDNEFLKMTHYAEGLQMLDIASDPRLAVWRNAKKAVGNVASERMLTGEILWVDYSKEAFVGDWEEAFPFHQMMGHKMVAGIPFLVGGKFTGFLGICFADAVKATDAKIQLWQTLAQHVALALHFTALAGEAEQSATLKERNRIAREIHDTLAQGFTGVIVQLNTAKRILRDGGGGNNIASAKIAPFIDRVIDLARESLAEARRSVGALRPINDDHVAAQIDLPRFLREKLESVTAEIGIKNKISISGTPIPLAPEIAVNLLRIGQEAITNALRHAQAQKIEIEIVYGAGDVCLCVCDDGQGFDHLQKDGGYGLKGMRERAAQLGAQLEIESLLGRGTKIKAFLKI